MRANLLVYTLLLLVTAAWSKAAAQDHDLQPFNPDSVFTLSATDIEHERIEANRPCTVTGRHDGRLLNGKYSYSPSKGTITLKWLAISLTAHVKHDGKHLHLYFDADRLLTLLRLLSGLSNSDTLKALAFLSDNYSDVQVGFELKPKK